MVLMEGAVIGKAEREGRELFRVATELGDVFVEGKEIPSRGYVLLTASVSKGQSSSGAWVSVKEATFVRALRADETVADVVRGPVGSQKAA